MFNRRLDYYSYIIQVINQGVQNLLLYIVEMFTYLV